MTPPDGFDLQISNGRGLSQARKTPATATSATSLQISDVTHDNRLALSNAVKPRKIGGSF